MIELFYMGGPLFMGIISIVGLTMIILAVRSGMLVMKGDDQGRKVLPMVKEAGLLAMVMGILGTLIGMYSAFAAIEQVVDISPAMLAGGFKVAMITTLYGIFIYVFSLLISLGLGWKARQ
ncbi:MAG: MotA/TolQ/ExbB proton channel family protein [Cyclobacteriaceae bacterium]